MIVELVLLFILAFVILYWYLTKEYDHFKDLDIPHVKPKFPFGTWNDRLLKGAIRREVSLSDYRNFPVWKIFYMRLFPI